MSSISINTSLIRNNIEELEKYKRYYSGKKSTFSSNAFGYNSKLANFLRKIQTIYNDIATNIENINFYLKEYCDSVEGIENEMCDKRGTIKDSYTSSIVSKAKNKIKNFKLDDSDLFIIKSLNNSSSPFKQFQMSIKKFMAPSATIILSFMEGAINVGEMFLDGAANVAAGCYSLAGYLTNSERDKNLADNLGKFVEQDLSKNLYYKVVHDLGYDYYYDPKSAGASISSLGGTLLTFIGASYLTSGISTAIFGTEATTATTCNMLLQGTFNALTNMGSETENALKNGANINQAEVTGLAAGGIGAVVGGISGALDQAARSLSNSLGFGKLANKAFSAIGIDVTSNNTLSLILNKARLPLLAGASFLVGGSEPILNEIVQTATYRNSQEFFDDEGNLITGKEKFLKNFLTNAQNDALLMQIIFAGGANALGTISNYFGGKNSQKDLEQKAKTIPDNDQNSKENSFTMSKKIKQEEFAKLSLEEKQNYLRNASPNHIEELIESGLSEDSSNILREILSRQEDFYDNKTIRKIIISNPEIYSELSDSYLFNILSNLDTTDADTAGLFKELYTRLDKDVSIIFQNYNIENLEGMKVRSMSSIFKEMDSTYQKKIIDSIEEMYEKLPSNLRDMCSHQFDMFDGALLAKNYLNGNIDDKGLAFLEKIFAKNNNVIKGLNSNMLNSSYLNDWGENFLSTIINNGEISNKIVYLHNNNPELYDSLVTIFKKSTDDNSLYTLYPKMLSTIDFIYENKHLLSNVDRSLLTTDNFINYILYRKVYEKNSHAIILDNFSADYEAEFIKLCDENFYANYNKKTSIPILQEQYFKQAKEVYYNRFFSTTSQDVKSLLAKYELSIDAIAKYDQDAVEAYRYLKLVDEITDKDQLKALYEVQNIHFTAEEFLSLDDRLRTAYVKTYIDELSPLNTLIKNNPVKGNKIPIIDAGDEFSIIVRSSNSGLVSDRVDLVESSYVRTWYQSDDPQNHIAAASFITQSNIGSCPVHADGVMYGFTDLAPSQIVMLSPTDINSNTNLIGYSSGDVQTFVSASDMPKYSMRVYNEVDLEKTNLSPNCVIIYDDFDETQLRSAYKAAEEWQIPIVKINKVKVATSQANNINSLMTSFKETKNLDTLKEALDLFESNSAGYKLNSYVPTGYIDRTASINNKTIYDLGLFDSVTIEKDIKDYINYLSNEESNATEVNKLISILETIQNRYNLSNTDNKLLAATKSNLDIEGLLNILYNIRR